MTLPDLTNVLRPFRFHAMDDIRPAPASQGAVRTGPGFGAAIVIAAAALLFAFAMSCGDHPKGPGCKTTKDCKSPLVCAENKCVECTEDSQCSKGMHCSA